MIDIKLNNFNRYIYTYTLYFNFYHITLFFVPNPLGYTQKLDIAETMHIFLHKNGNRRRERKKN